jgi:hypothetical protein
MKPFSVHPNLIVVIVFLALLMAFSTNPFLAPVFAQGWLILVAAAHVLFAIGIARDARLRHDRDELLFVDSLIWGLTVLVFGLTAVALYWLMHCSRLKGK